VYRISQFFRALVAWVPKQELSLLSEYLTPLQAELFQRMPRCDQRHGLDVFHALRTKQHNDHDLLIAALLHDVGKSGGFLSPSTSPRPEARPEGSGRRLSKGGRLRLWHRVLIVLIEALKPQPFDGPLVLWHCTGPLVLGPKDPGRSSTVPRDKGLRTPLLDRLASEEPPSWRYPFFVHQQHPELGAELAQAAGCSPTTVELIRRHQEPLADNPFRTHEDELLAALQEAEGVN